MASWTFAALCFFGFGNCLFSGGSPTGERELRPPESGIRVGSLYYVRERPTEDISKPAHLIPLCTTRLERYGIKPEVHQVANIDLMEKLESSAGIDGIKYEFAQLGLNGSLTDYFTYTLTNVVRTDIQKVEADRILNQRGVESDCADWRDSMRGYNWGVYQVSSISAGDIVFKKNSEFAAGADVKVKIANFEPKLKSAIKKMAGMTLSGKGLVVSFQPILRN